jgi:acetylornithine/N-succinyldiaminopimelate aminotransferase
MGLFMKESKQAKGVSLMSFLMDTYKRLPVSFVRGEGVYLYDEKGKRYLDLVGGVAVNVLGHSDTDLVGALCEQASKLWHVSNLYQNPWQEETGRVLGKGGGTL